MTEEKNIDFCELRNLVFEITDLNEICNCCSGDSKRHRIKQGYYSIKMQ